MAAPIGGGDLVFDQGIDGFGIRNAQQGFGEAHQRDAFVSGEAVFGHENLHDAGIAFGANFGDEICRAGGGGRFQSVCDARFVLQIGQQNLFIRKVRGADFCAKSLKISHESASMQKVV